MRPEEMVGQMLGHYRILRPLGHGGTAIVFLAQDIHLQRNVAIKVFLPREDDTQDFLRRFAREARVLAQLDHPNILPVYEYGEEGTLAFLVMPHMAGGSLRDWLRVRGAISPRKLYSYSVRFSVHCNMPMSAISFIAISSPAICSLKQMEH